MKIRKTISTLCAAAMLLSTVSLASAAEPDSLSMYAAPSARTERSAVQTAEAALDVAAAGKAALEEAAVQIRFAETAEQIKIAEAAIECTPAVMKEYVDETGTPRLVWERTFKNVFVKTSQASGVYVDITVNMQEDTSNTSGFRIVAIQIPVVTGKVGYTYVSDNDVSIVNRTYSDGNQTAALTIQFYGRIGSMDPLVYFQGNTTISLL